MTAVIFKIFLLFTLLGLSAFFSGSETALFSLQHLEVERLKRENGGFLRNSLLKLLDRKESLLATVLIGNEAVNIGASSLAASLAFSALGDKGLGISVAVMTFLIVLYGEILPKTLAVSHATTWAKLSAPLLLFIFYLVSPLRLILTSFASTISHRIGKEEPSIGEEEFKALVDEGKKKGLLMEMEREMIHKVFRMSDATVKEIITPRTEMFVLDVKTPPMKAYEKVKEVTFREIPLVEGSLDNVVGVIRTKDLLGLPWGIKKIETLREVMYEPYFVPESRKASELLKDFQKNRLHMAIVVDEYGGVAGLITLEDIIEELVGEIQDEFEAGKLEPVRETSPCTYQVLPRADLEEFSKRIGLSIPEEVDVETVGGLVLHLFGRLPKKGEGVEFDGWRFTVEEVRRTKILKLKVERIDKGAKE